MKKAARLTLCLLFFIGFAGISHIPEAYTTSFETLSESGKLESSDQDIHENEEDDDPLEDFNRFMFAFNELFDAILLKPVAIVYDTLFPDPIKTGVGNVLNNLAEPVTFINDILQLKFDRAGETFARFTLNSTFGLGGIFDVANDLGEIPRHKEDFGQTLGYAGVNSGPYLVLPFIGPSNFRDMVGTAVDVITDPIDHGFRRLDRRSLVYVRKGVDIVHRRAGALELTRSIDKTAPDKYLRYKALYNQYRRFKIDDGITAVSEEDSVEMVE